MCPQLYKHFVTVKSQTAVTESAFSFLISWETQDCDYRINECEARLSDLTLIF